MNQMRDWTGSCQRCYRPTNMHTMSMFDVSLICMQCADAERKHPQYSKAEEAERSSRGLVPHLSSNQEWSGSSQMTYELKDIKFEGNMLRWIVEEDLLRTGELVYCFVDEGYQFRVWPRRLINGVRELIFSNESRNKFVVVI